MTAAAERSQDGFSWLLKAIQWMTISPHYSPSLTEQPANPITQQILGLPAWLPTHLYAETNCDRCVQYRAKERGSVRNCSLNKMQCKRTKVSFDFTLSKQFILHFLATVPRDCFHTIMIWLPEQ